MPISLNIEHLEKTLAQWFYLKDQQVKGYWVYAERKDDKYIPTTALSEGDFCVDDVARVILLYSEAYEIMKDEMYLKLALDASKFVLQMQASDGEFYNFAYLDGTINQHGSTSRKSTSWWALRAFWALAKLYNVSKDQNLLEPLQRAFKAILRNPPNYNDQKAIYLLGLCEYAKISSDTVKIIESIAKELQNCIKQSGIFEGFFSWNNQRFAWNGWGNRYAEALIEAYKTTGIESLLQTAVDSLKKQIPLLLGTGFVYSVDKAVKLFPELSYAVESLLVASAKAYHITKEEQLAFLCALTGGWYFGLNRLNQPMVGPKGEGYDGMEYMHINHNAGAESTICAQRSILYLSTLPEFYQRLATESKLVGMNGLMILEAESFDPGVSDVSTIIGDFGAGAAIAFKGKARLRWTNLKLTDPATLAVSGAFKSAKITVIAGNNLSSELIGEGIFEIGKLEPASTLRISLEGEGIIDQLILLPERIGISIELDGKYFTLVYSPQDKLQLKEEAIFVSLKELIVQEIAANYIEHGEYLLLDLNRLFNNDGIGFREKPANFDNLGGVVGSYYPGEFLKEGILMVEQVPFMIKIEGKDNVRMRSQKILFEQPIKVKKIHLLCSANHGDYETAIFVNEQPLKFLVRDWCVGKKPIQFEYRYLATGEKQFINCGIDHITVNVDSIIEEIVFSDSINVHVFAVTLQLCE